MAARASGKRAPKLAVPALAAEASAKPRQATVHEAKTHLSRLLDEVETGSTVVITRRGKPVAKLEPLAPLERRPVFGSMKGLIDIDHRFFEPLPEDELRLWNCE
jgi:prevent-host-death family protein